MKCFFTICVNDDDDDNNELCLLLTLILIGFFFDARAFDLALGASQPVLLPSSLLEGIASSNSIAPPVPVIFAKAASRYDLGEAGGEEGGLVDEQT